MRSLNRQQAETTLLLMFGLTIGGVWATVSLLGDALIPIIERKYGAQIERRPFLRTLYGLVKRGMLYQDPRTQEWRLTDKGVRRARTYMVRDLHLPRPTQPWDGRWCVVAFDIPERARYLRGIFRRKLRSLGFTYLQRSCWIYPFPCEQEIKELAHRLGLKKDIVIATAQLHTAEASLLRRYSLARPRPR